MIDLPSRTTIRVPAFRIDDRGHVTMKANCPFCQVMAIDRDSTGAGCPHLVGLDHSFSGSYFTFEGEQC